MGKNVITFGADITSSVHVDNKNKDIFILNEGSTQKLDDTTLTIEAKYHISFIQHFTQSLQYNRRNSFSFVNATKIFQFKQKNSEIKDYTLY